MRHFAVLKFRERLRHAAAIRNAKQRGAVVRREHDVPVVAPACAAHVRGVAEFDCRAALHENLLQGAARREAQPLAVGREERRSGPIGARDRPAVRLVQKARVDSLDVVLAPHHVSDPRTVG